MIPTPNCRFSETPAETTRLRNDVEVRTYEKRSIPIGARDFDGGALVPTSALAASVTDWERMARGLLRATGSVGSCNWTFIPRTKLPFRPTLTRHRCSLPFCQYAHKMSRGLATALITSTSLTVPLVASSPSAFRSRSTSSSAAATVAAFAADSAISLWRLLACASASAWAGGGVWAGQCRSYPLCPFVFLADGSSSESVSEQRASSHKP